MENAWKNDRIYIHCCEKHEYDRVLTKRAYNTGQFSKNSPFFTLNSRYLDCGVRQLLIFIFGSFFATYALKDFTRNLFSHDFIVEKTFFLSQVLSHYAVAREVRKTLATFFRIWTFFQRGGFP